MVETCQRGSMVIEDVDRDSVSEGLTGKARPMTASSPYRLHSTPSSIMFPDNDHRRNAERAYPCKKARSKRLCEMPKAETEGFPLLS